MTINERMFKIMEEKNIKATELSKILNINNSTISTWKKTGKNPPAEYIVRISELLNVTTDFLLGNGKNEYTEEEKRLLQYFRNCNKGNKQIILNAAKSLQEPEQKQDIATSSEYKIG